MLSFVNPRRSLSVGLVVYALVTALWVTTTTAQTCPHDGDVNQDGALNPGDALLALQHYLGIASPPLSACQQDHANVNNPTGSAITPADALCIFQRFLGLASCLDPLAPVASPDTIATDEDTPFTGILHARDANGDALTFRIVTNGSLGAVTITNVATGAFTYTPNANATGTDTFQFVANDGTADSAITTVTVIISPANDAPVARDDTGIGTGVNTSVIISVLANDEDFDNNALTITAVTPGTQGGSVTTNGRTVTYTPAVDFIGRDTFTYTVIDGQGGTATATVTVDVTTSNNSPVVRDDTSSTDEGTPVAIAVLANDTDPDGNTLSIAAVIPLTTTQGTLMLNGPNIIYTPPGGRFSGTDTFSYQACDNGVPVFCGAAQVTVTVNAVNVPPSVATPLADVAVNEDAPNTVLDLSATFSDPDITTNGDRLTLNVVSNTNPALLTTSLVNTQLTLTYLKDRNGTAVITVRATDQAGTSVDAIFQVTVNAVNDAPQITVPPPPQTNIVGRRITPLNLRQAMTIEDAEDGACTACTVTVSGLPFNLQVLKNTQGQETIQGRIAYNAFGRGVDGGPIYPVTVTVTDLNGGTATSTFEWRASQGGVEVVDPDVSGEGDGDGDGDSADGDGGADGDASDGGDASPLAGAICTFVDMNGEPFQVAEGQSVQVIQTTADENGKFLLRIPADPNHPGFVMDWQGFVECSPPGKSDLLVSTYLDTRGLKRGERLTGLKVDPTTTVSRPLADGLHAVNAATDLVAVQARLRDDISGLQTGSPQDITSEEPNNPACNSPEPTSIVTDAIDIPLRPLPTDTTGNNKARMASYIASQLFLAAFEGGAVGTTSPTEQADSGCVAGIGAPQAPETFMTALKTYYAMAMTEATTADLQNLLISLGLQEDEGIITGPTDPGCG